MNKEKIVLSIIAILLGLFVAGGAFYIFQTASSINEPPVETQSPTQSPTKPPENNNLLILEEPQDEQVFTKRIINIKGKTAKDATVIISTASIDQVVTPSANGEFTLTHTLEDGINILKVTSIFSDGTEKSITRTVSSTSEDF